MASYPSCRARVSKLLITSGKNGFTMSDTIIPSVRLSREARWRACAFGKYPRRFTVNITMRWVRWPTFPVLFKTLDTVAVDTPAALATSRIVRPIAPAFRCPRQGFDVTTEVRYLKTARCAEYKSKKVLD